MSTKLVLLKNGDYIISDVKELVSEEKPFKYLFSNPHKVILNSSVFLSESAEEDVENMVNVTLTPWMILSDDKEMIMPLDSVLTIVEPIQSLKEMFEEKVNGKEYQVSSLES